MQVLQYKFYKKHYTTPINHYQNPSDEGGVIFIYLLVYMGHLKVERKLYRVPSALKRAR